MRLLNIDINKSFNINSVGQDYFVGDIHGNYDLLINQLNKISFNYKVDRLFAVGDIIDRGEQTEQCLELLLEPWFHSVLGNHEYLFLQGFNNPEYWQILLNNGGEWIKKWFKSTNRLLGWGHLIRIKMSLSMSIKTEMGMIGVIHAESPVNWQELDNLKIDENTVIPYIWSRRNLITCTGAAINNISAVVHGHNSVNAPIVINNQIWIDTLKKSAVLTILKHSEIFDLIKGKN